jgi:tRNA (guanine37-N1)-methyltransferase
MITDALSYSIIGRAQKEGIVSITAVNIRDFAGNKHNKVDDYPFGGGAGMVMTAPPIYECFTHVKAGIDGGVKVLCMSPGGKIFNQQTAEELSKEKNLVIICGHYEGIDERAIELTKAEELSVGEYVLTGGEIAALAVIDAAVRLIDGALGKAESHQNDSFSQGLLEHPQYTRPREYMGKEAPQVLLSGNHKEIEKWRHEQSVRKTMRQNNAAL